jgi:anti-sigma factor RsiW
MGKHCGRILDRLAEYVDELLSADERAEVDQHLGKCPPCRNCATEEQVARTVLRARAARLRSPSVSPDVRSRCAALLRAKGRQGKG